jgi:hypothetical protein
MKTEQITKGRHMRACEQSKKSTDERITLHVASWGEYEKCVESRHNWIFLLSKVACW